MTKKQVYPSLGIAPSLEDASFVGWWRPELEPYNLLKNKLQINTAYLL